MKLIVIPNRLKTSLTMSSISFLFRVEFVSARAMSSKLNPRNERDYKIQHFLQHFGNKRKKTKMLEEVFGESKSLQKKGLEK